MQAKKDVLIFTGSGATSASNKLVHLLGLKNQNFQSEEEQPVVFIGPYEHHSNMLPWRESAAKIVTIRELPSTGQIDIGHLRSELIKYNNGKRMLIGAFSAASNITGILTDVDHITALMHVYGGYAIWDYACAAPYVKIDMNVSKQMYGVSCHKDAIFFSPHKFIGGPSTPGVLLVKKHMFKNTQVPTQPGGDTVFFVTEHDHRYLKKPHEREEGGTPDIVGAVRCGLVFQLKSAIGEDYIEQLEQNLFRKAMTSFSQNKNLIILGSYKDEGKSISVKKLPIFSFIVRLNDKYMLHYNFVSTLLNDLFGIQSRGGCACAGPYALRLLGISYEMAKQIESALLMDDDYEFLRPGFTRINFNYFFNEETTNYVIEAVHWVANHGWKLMPYYTFYPDTGEWKHYLNKKTANNRRWIHNIDYSNGKMEYRHQVNQRIPYNKYKKEYDKYLKEANEILDRAMEEFEACSMFKINKQSEDVPYKGGGFQIPDQKLLLNNNPKVNELRWFIYPSEALHYLREGNLLREDQIFERKCPFTPIQYVSSPDNLSMNDDHIESESIACHTMEETNAQVSHNLELEEDEADNLLGIGAALQDGSDNESNVTTKESPLWPKVPLKKILTPVKRAVMEFGMIQDGDRLLLGLSGGKDSLTLLHVLHTLQTRSNLPFRFEFGACTVDPQTDSYDPRPLINYCKQLGVPYYFESQNIIETAKTCQASSICSWCSRMKRGILYNVARRHGYNVLVLGQHLDDLAESFIMSILHNGYLRTMKANYTIDEGDLRVIRPLIYVREKELKKFARENLLPVINENCPACFEMPKERARVKTLLSNQEHLFPDLFHSLETAMRPLMDNTMDKIVGADHRKYKSNPKNKWKSSSSSSSNNNTNNKESNGHGEEEVNGARPAPSFTINKMLGKKSGRSAKNVELLLSEVDTNLLEKELARRRGGDTGNNSASPPRF
jgi:selenocysteine lyase/cysteine desulfurase/tRNA(Ile)-lysidine synthase TilS/MesJ